MRMRSEFVLVRGIYIHINRSRGPFTRKKIIFAAKSRGLFSEPADRLPFSGASSSPRDRPAGSQVSMSRDRSSRATGAARIGPEHRRSRREIR